MPEETTTQPAPETGAQSADTESADYWKRRSREWEDRAKANASAAEKLAKMEQSQKTDAERTAERITMLEQQVASAAHDALRFKIAARYSIADDDVDLFLTGTDEKTLVAQAERLSQKSDAGKRKNVVPKEGTTAGAPSPEPLREVTRELFHRS